MFLRLTSVASKLHLFVRVLKLSDLHSEWNRHMLPHKSSLTTPSLVSIMKSDSISELLTILFVGRKLRQTNEIMNLLCRFKFRLDYYDN